MGLGCDMPSEAAIEDRVIRHGEAIPWRAQVVNTRCYERVLGPTPRPPEGQYGLPLKLAVAGIHDDSVRTPATGSTRH